MKFSEFTPEQQETLKEELDPNKPGNLLTSLIDEIYDTWGECYAIMSEDMIDLCKNFRHFENYSYDDGFYSPVLDNLEEIQAEEEEYSSQLYLKHTQLYDEDGDEYFSFYDDVCDVNQAIANTVKLRKNKQRFSPWLEFDIDEAVETIQKAAYDFLHEEEK